ncbi:MAG TPA: DUF222 domain-containing protein [Nocardioidaceae bacterium]|nr:DUF222 domain-containing protein [Nocardioidaceae bacterium]
MSQAAQLEEAVFTTTADGPACLDLPGLHAFLTGLAGLDREVTDAERIDQIRMLEDIKAAVAAAQARAEVDLSDSVKARHQELGLPARRRGRDVGAQIALARRESHARGDQLLGVATAVVTEMPHTHAALTHGRLSEKRAEALVRESAHLSREDRTRLDAELCADPRTLEGKGTKSVAAMARQVAYRLDPAGAVRRQRKAHTERRVTCRPAPDTMAYLSALLPATQAVAVFAALSKCAEQARAGGDPRSRGQVMADTLVERVTGQSTAPAVPVQIQLVLTDRTLLAGGPDPAHLAGYGPLPAQGARDHILALLDQAGATDSELRDTSVWLRRVYAHPTTGQLTGMDSHSRTAPSGMRHLVATRDQTCRNSWCDAPVRHIDHPVPHHAGGPTSVLNSQGLCEACNYVKESPGWRTRRGPYSGEPGAPHTVVTTTPTGHSYTSSSPPLAGTTLPHQRAPGRHAGPAAQNAPPTRQAGSPLDNQFHRLIHAA